MAMANAAWALATHGERVLTIDWDLEAPGLHRYFHPFLSDPNQTETDGLVDRLWDYVRQLSDWDLAVDADDLAQADAIVQVLDIPVETSGCLHFIGAGRQNEEYSQKVGGLDWAAFYGRFGGEAFLDRLMDWARANYTHVLIDSRTGVADTAGVCTTQLPDALVLCMVYNRQSIEGTAAVAHSVVKGRRARKQKPVSLFVVPSRVEDRNAVDSARRQTASLLAPLLRMPKSVFAREIKRSEIRHYPWCAFEEKLAVFEDTPDERGSLLDNMHALAARISGQEELPPIEIDPGTLATYWRRAAFDDPRLADLEELATAPLSESVARFVPWIEDALESREERFDWLSALSLASARISSTQAELAGTGVGDFLSAGAMRLAQRAYKMDRLGFRSSLAVVLQSRSDYLQQSGLVGDALDLAREAEILLLRDKSPTGQWVHARSLERVAELVYLAEGPAAAIPLYRKMVDLHLSLSRRAKPVGGEIHTARVQRLLAERYADVGDYEAALAVIREAAHGLPPYLHRSPARAVPEIIQVLSYYAEIAATVSPELGRKVIREVRIRGEEFYDLGRSQLTFERRLAVVEADLLTREGKFDQALALLEALTDDGMPSSVIAEARANVLLQMGRNAEAVALLEPITRSGTRLPSQKVLRLIAEAARRAEDPGLLYSVVLRAAQNADVSEMRALLDLLEETAMRVSPSVQGEFRALTSIFSHLKRGAPTVPDSSAS